MNPLIFREYDIRGIAGKDITETDVELLGKGIGTYLQRKGCQDLSIGRDCRVTSDRYAQLLMAGLRATGCHVTDIGVVPTPLLYFSIAHLQKQGGVMITASHNPGEYNGFKICKGLESVHGQQIQEIYQLIQKQDFETGEGTYQSAEVADAYERRILSDVQLARPLRIGVDAANGTGGVIAVPLLRQLGCEVHDIFCEMDGTFPNHPADPTVLANMQDLIALVKEKELDAGIGYDGDGDRIGVVDEQGQIIYGDKLMVIFAREILARKPGSTFISEVKCSQVMYDDIRRQGGNAIMWKTGHSLIKEKMKIEKAELAGEMSGHMFFADRYYGFDDATYASCRLLEIMAQSDQPLSALIADLPEMFNTPEIRVDCPDEIKFDVVSRVTSHFQKTHEVIDIDGARVLFGDGWGLVRASNTQPALVLRFEAASTRRLEEIRTTVEETLARLQES